MSSKDQIMNRIVVIGPAFEHHTTILFIINEHIVTDEHVNVKRVTIAHIDL
jgi:hypothetical protein